MELLGLLASPENAGPLHSTPLEVYSRMVQLLLLRDALLLAVSLESLYRLTQYISDAAASLDSLSGCSCVEVLVCLLTVRDVELSTGGGAWDPLLGVKLLRVSEDGRSVEELASHSCDSGNDSHQQQSNCNSNHRQTQQRVVVASSKTAAPSNPTTHPAIAAKPSSSGLRPSSNATSNSSSSCNHTATALSTSSQSSNAAVPNSNTTNTSALISAPHHMHTHTHTHQQGSVVPVPNSSSSTTIAGGGPGDSGGGACSSAKLRPVAAVATLTAASSASMSVCGPKALAQQSKCPTKTSPFLAKSLLAAADSQQQKHVVQHSQGLSTPLPLPFSSSPLPPPHSSSSSSSSSLPSSLPSSVLSKMSNGSPLTSVNSHLQAKPIATDASSVSSSSSSLSSSAAFAMKW